MPKPKQTEPEVFEQVEDEQGRIRLDRQLTGEEAAAQDEENRRRLEENRKLTFARRHVPATS